MLFSFVFYVLFQGLLGFAEEIGVESDGSLTSFPAGNDHRVIQVTNGCDESISLFWGSNADEEAHMFDLEPLGKSIINTFNGHSFFATDFEGKKNVIAAFSIQDGIDNVTINPKKNGSGDNHDLWSPVQIMGKRTKSLTAKFRCLCPALDYYYDDGKDGVFSGSLVLGTVVSTNTYEGHVFYFTEKGNKSNEIARLTMTNKQVRPASELQMKKSIVFTEFNQNCRHCTSCQIRIIPHRRLF